VRRLEARRRVGRRSVVDEQRLDRRRAESTSPMATALSPSIAAPPNGSSDAAVYHTHRTVCGRCRHTYRARISQSDQRVH
jgi:hypothetical protein